MIQRIQTVYLALAVLLLVLCCCMPLATFEPHGMGVPATMFSIALLDGGGAIQSYVPVCLLIVAALAEVATIAAVIGYRNRRRQMKTCSWAILFDLIWLVVYAVLAFILVPDTTVHPGFAVALPVVCLILTWLARRAIKKDDDLVRSADRIR